MIRHRHGFTREDGVSGMHEGRIEDCPESYCSWPQVGALVTIPDGDLERTGAVTYRSGPLRWDDIVVVHTPSGRTYRAAAGDARKPDWGAFCPHGLKIAEAAPAEHTCSEREGGVLLRDDFLPGYGHLGGLSMCPACYPATQMVEVWPCPEPGCTREAYERELQEEIDRYHEEREAEYRNSLGY